MQWVIPRYYQLSLTITVKLNDSTQQITKQTLYSYLQLEMRLAKPGFVSPAAHTKHIKLEWKPGAVLISHVVVSAQSCKL